jgi:long-chain acyl-CoA synthetase
MNPRTVFHLLEEAAQKYGAAAALHQPVHEGGHRKYRVYSWIEYRDAALEIGAGLRALGIRKGDIVALGSETRAEFYVADIGVMAAGGVAAALYVNYPAADLVRTIGVCRARMLFVEDPKMLAALKDASVERFILLTGAAEGAMTLDELRATGVEAMAADPELAGRMRREVTPSDNAILYLTSGATGEPKMAIWRW